MKIALLTTDSREYFKVYDRTTPFFGTAPEALLQGFTEIPEVEIHVICCNQASMISPKKIADNIFYHGLHVSKIGWMRTLYSGCVRAVKKKLNELKPNIVHGQGTERECALAAVLCGYPNVVTLHGIMSEMASLLHARPFRFYWFASKLENFALRRADGVFCNSHFTEEKVRKRCRKTWLVPNPVRQEFFQKPLPNTAPPKCTLLNVGTVCTYKRQNELLNVLEKLHREGLQFQMEFIGSASRSNAYGTGFLDRVQNSSYISWADYKKLDELIATLDNASALVHVSKVETFGLVVAEALARNLKFFGFRVGGIPDIAEKVDRAELFVDGDWTALKNGIAHWIRSGAPRPSTAASVMQERYHPVEIARQHLGIYREVLNKTA